MFLSKYKKSILLYIPFFAFFLFLAVATFITPMGSEELSPFLPGDNWGLEFAVVIIVLMPLMAL